MPVAIKESFEKRFPLSILVEFIKNDRSFLGTQLFQAHRSGDRVRPLQDDAPVVFVVPVESEGSGQLLCHRGFTDLPRSGQKRHLAMLIEVFGEYLLVETRRQRVVRFRCHRKMV